MSEPGVGGNGGATEDSMRARAIDLWVLASLAVAQPLFAILGPNPPFFVAHRMEGVDVALLVAVLLGGAPVAALLLEALAGRVGRRARRWTHLALCGVLVALMLRPVLGRLVGGHEALAVGGALGGAAAFMALHRRWATGRELLRFLAPIPLVFLGVFLWSEGVRPLLVTAGSGATLGGTAGATPIVFLVLDELPLHTLIDEERRIDATLFPSFARLASRSVWFRNATARHTLTNIAMPSLLTGRRVAGMTARRSPDNLFSWLAGSHRMIAREAVTSLCPPGACEQISKDNGSDATVLLRDVAVVYAHWALPRSLTRTLPPIEAQWADFSNRKDPLERENLMRSFISSIRDDGRATLHFLHVLLPHVPWAGLPSGKTYPAHFNQVVGHRPADEWPVTIAFQRHLLQVGYVDRWLGRLLDRLDATGLFDRALIVVTSDHGVAFQPGLHRRDLDEENLRDVLHVPLFVKPPGLAEGRVSDRNVESIDVLPTIADAVGKPLPFAVDGRSALDPAAPERSEKHAASVGRQWTFDGRLPSTWAGLQRKIALIGRTPTWDDVWAIASAPELIGRRVDAAAIVERAELSYGLADAEDFDDVQPASGEIPSYVRGIVWAADRDALPDQIAVVVDGVVRGVGRLFDERDSTVFLSAVVDPRATGIFAMMLPEPVFHPGRHRVEAFAVAPGGRLERMRVGALPPMSAAVAAWPDT